MGGGGHDQSSYDDPQNSGQRPHLGRDRFNIGDQVEITIEYNPYVKPDPKAFWEKTKDGPRPTFRTMGVIVGQSDKGSWFVRVMNAKKNHPIGIEVREEYIKFIAPAVTPRKISNSVYLV